MSRRYAVKRGRDGRLQFNWGLVAGALALGSIAVRLGQSFLSPSVLFLAVLAVAAPLILIDVFLTRRDQRQDGDQEFRGEVEAFISSLGALFTSDASEVDENLRNLDVRTNGDVVIATFHLASRGPFGYRVEARRDGLLEVGPERLAAYVWLAIAEFVHTADLDRVPIGEDGVRWIPDED